MAYMHLEILTHAGDLELLKSAYISLCMYIHMRINTHAHKYTNKMTHLSSPYILFQKKKKTRYNKACVV